MNHTTQTILGTLVVIGFVMGALYLYEGSAKDQAAEDMHPAATTEYRNADHGYTLSYPADLAILEYTPDMATIGRKTEDGIEGVADVRVAVIEGEPGESFVEAAARDLSELCAADGPRASFSCTGIEHSAPFTAASGAQGLEVYLTGERKDIGTGETAAVQKGPYFVFLMEGGASASKVLVVHAPLNQTADEADADSIRGIAESVTFTKEAPGIEEYVADNISSLSPEAAQLGGTFYVTRIDAKDGAGSVSYEDGHSAYTADFTYSLDDAGAVSVDSFVVRP